MTSSCWYVSYHDNCEKCSPHCIFHHSIIFLVRSFPPYDLLLPYFLVFKLSIISILTASEISRLKLVSVAEQVALSLTGHQLFRVDAHIDVNHFMSII